MMNSLNNSVNIQIIVDSENMQEMTTEQIDAIMLGVYQLASLNSEPSEVENFSMPQTDPEGVAFMEGLIQSDMEYPEND